MAIKYTIAQHATANPAKVLARLGGKHIYSVKLTSDTDNGNLIARGAWLGRDLYEEAAATKFTGIVRQQEPNGNWLVEVTDPGDALFCYVAPIIEEEFNNTFKKESNFYNAKGDVVRAYELAVGDTLEVSEEGFSATPTAGAAVTGVAAKKMTI